VISLPGDSALVRLDPEIPCPEYVIVGTITRDIVSNGFVPGGTVTYASVAALALNRSVGAVASVGPETPIAELVPGAQLCIRPAAATTTFENVYRDGRRHQWLRAVAAPLDLDLIPPAWLNSPILHLAPLANDIGADVVQGVRGAGLVGLTPQGWMRAWDAEGAVRRRQWPDPELTLRTCDATVFSEEDVEGDWTLCESYARHAKLLVVTRGAQGCVVYDRGIPWHVPAFPVVEVDATGAGDVFAAAFFIGLSDSGNPIEAARYANCVASFVVEVVGANGIPAAEVIAERLSTASGALVKAR
jgi:hypothetical protein